MFGDDGIKTFEILFDKSVQIPGQVVSGSVILELSKPCKSKGIEINIRGSGRCAWSEGKNKNYQAETVYLNHTQYVVGGFGELGFPAGRSVFPFSYLLAAGLPSSFRHTWGAIRYSVQATLKKSWSLDTSVVQIFYVNRILRLCDIPRARDPIWLNSQESVSCFCFANGVVGYNFTLPKRAFVPGEFVNFTLEIDNLSNTEVTKTEVLFLRYVSYYTQRASKDERDVIATHFGPGVKAGESEIWNANPETSIFPVAVPTTLEGIIRIQYAIKIIIYVKGSMTVECKTKIWIGNVTLPDSNDRQ